MMEQLLWRPCLRAVIETNQVQDLLIHISLKGELVWQEGCFKTICACELLCAT